MRERLRPDAAIPLLERFWDLPDGYFFRLRQGEYQVGGAAEVDLVLRSIDIDELGSLPRRLVSLTWYIPTFMEWQIERVRERGGDVDALRQDITRLQNALDKLLGVP
jgi:hypothetical protein